MPEEAPRHGRERPRTFVVRLWFEPAGESDPGDAGEWRGEVRDVTSRAVVRFRRLEGLAKAVREFGLAGP